MNDWFRAIAEGSQLPAEAASRLGNDGFCIVPGPLPAGALASLASAYDRAMTEACSGDRSEGSTTVRVHDFVNRGLEFDSLYVYAPLLAACCQVIGQPFKLSSMLGRTLLPGKPSQGLHVDYACDDHGWTMIGFIFMIDEFREDNGATYFVPGSQGQAAIEAGCDRIVPACGRAGSMIIYNGSVWHGHGANTTAEPRRSIQGSFIRREAKSWIDLASRMRLETFDRISPLARYLVGAVEHR